MPTTVTTLMARIRRKLEDVQGIHWSDAEVIAAINESKNDLYDLISLRNRDVLPTVTEEYVWSADKMSEHMSVIFNNYEIGTFDILLEVFCQKTKTLQQTTLLYLYLKRTLRSCIGRGLGFLGSMETL